MEQRASQRPWTPSRSADPDAADPLANVRSLADCVEEWAALHRRAIPVPPVAVEPRTEAGDTSTTNHQESERHCRNSHDT
jgi:hypothetical protein